MGRTITGNNTPWSQQELDILRKAPTLAEPWDIRYQLPERTDKAIMAKASQIGVSMGKVYFVWYPEIERLLTELAGKIPAKEIAPKINAMSEAFGHKNPPATYKMVRSKAIRMGLSVATRTWGKDEDQLVLDAHLKLTAKELADQLPKRNEQQVRARASLLCVELVKIERKGLKLNRKLTPEELERSLIERAERSKKRRQRAMTKDEVIVDMKPSVHKLLCQSWGASA